MIKILYLISKHYFSLFAYYIELVLNQISPIFPKKNLKNTTYGQFLNFSYEYHYNIYCLCT